jgi:hypothetical protein
MTMLIIETVSFILLLTSLLYDISSITYVQAQVDGHNVPRKITSQFTNIVGIDWLIAFGMIAGAIMTLAAANKIVLKLMKQPVNYNWRNRFK